MTTNPDCYGNMFPDLDRLRYNQPQAGKVFEVLVASLGIGVQSRRMTVNDVQWASCVACDAYRHCYDLSVAKLLLHEAMMNK